MPNNYKNMIYMFIFIIIKEFACFIINSFTNKIECLLFCDLYQQMYVRCSLNNVTHSAAIVK